MPEQLEPGTAMGDQGADFAPLYISSMLIRNFRGITECQIEFDPSLTILVGPNNVGKSRVMRALALALGSAPANRDDFTVASGDEATIDVVISPAARIGTNGMTSEASDAGPAEEKGDDQDQEASGEAEIFADRVVRRLIGVTSISEQPERQRFAWRTYIRPSQEGHGARIEHVELIYDHGSQDWTATSGFTLSRDQRSIVAADLVNTGRDLANEMARRGSPISRVLDDLDVDPNARSELEAALSSLSLQIVNASGSMRAVQHALVSLEESVDGVGTPSLQPLPVRLEELSRSVSVDLDSGAGPLPMRLHGAGARSLSSLQVQGVLYDRRLGRDGLAMRPHPVSLIEEPEAHLHPQAQFELPSLLARIRGQVIVTTHSAHLVSVAEPRSLRMLRQDCGRIDAIDLRPTDDDASDRARRPRLHLQEMEKLRRMVERPFGELVFASAVVLGDGATERALIPPLARHSLGTSAQGLCVVDPGSMASDMALAVVKFANLVGLPWLLFSDSDDAGRQAAEKLVRDHGSGNESLIVWVSAGEGVDSAEATERMFLNVCPEVCAAACEHLSHEQNKDMDALLSVMKKYKGAIGNLLAAELIKRYPWLTHANQWPEPLRELINRLDGILSDGHGDDERVRS